MNLEQIKEIAASIVIEMEIKGLINDNSDIDAMTIIINKLKTNI